MMPSSNTDPAQKPTAFPSFELTYIFDDEENPTKVTVFSKLDDDIETGWISIDADHAIDLADVA